MRGTSRQNRHLIFAASLAALDTIFFGMLNAARVPSFVIMAGFLLVVLNGWFLLYNLCKIGSIYGIHIRRKMRVAAYGTVVLGLLIALQSVGQLSGRDIAVLLPLAAIGYGYSLYLRSERAI